MTIQDLERRVRAAARATAEEIAPGTIPPLSLAGEPTGRQAGTDQAGTGRLDTARRSRLWLLRPRLITPVAAAAAVLAVVAAALVITGGPREHPGGSRPGGPAVRASATPSATPTPTPTPISQAAALASVQGATSINCDNAIIDAVSGNPVTDCASIWQHSFGQAVPQLAVYANDGWVLVLPARQRPWAGSVRLPSGFVMNTGLIVLNEWLQDYVNGLNSKCYASSAAVTAVRGELASLGLSGWNVRVQPPAANGTRTCANIGLIFASQRVVQLQPSPPQSSGKELTQQMQPLAAALRQIGSSCEDLPAAAAAAKAAAAHFGVSLSSASGDQFQEVTVPGAHCTTAYLELGGAIFLTLRGPAAPAP
jgi:hypothetical protein